MLSHLQGLILGENKLTGHIPWQLGHLHEVLVFALRKYSATVLPVFCRSILYSVAAFEVVDVVYKAIASVALIIPLI